MSISFPHHRVRASARFLFGFLCFLALTAGPGSRGRTVTAQQSGRFSTRVDVELVTAEVRVLDKNGQPVHNLKKENFRLFEDGKQQEIASFDEVTGSNDGRGKTVLILFDDRTIAPSHIREIRDAAEKYVMDHMGAQDLFAVIANGLSLEILQNFTEDAEKVVAAIRRNTIPGGTTSTMGSRTVSGSGLDFIRSLEYLSQSLERIRGQKSVLLFSGNIVLVPSSVSQDLYLKTIRSARRSNVVFFTIETERLDSSAFESGPLTPGRNNRFPSSIIESTNGPGTTADYLRSLASDTGGVSFYNVHEVDKTLDGLNERLSNYYILGFQSGNPKRDGSFRKLEVKTDVKNAKLDFRKGYVDRRPLDVLANSKREKALLDALAASTPAVELPVSFRSMYFYDSPRLARVLIASRIRLEKAAFRKRGGQWACDLNVMGAAYSENDTVAARFSETVPATVEEGKERNFSLNYRNYFKLRPGRYRLKLAASDGENNLGTMEQVLEIPALPENGFVGSSLIVAEGTSALPALIANLESTLLDDSDPLVYSGLQVFPSIENRFSVSSFPVLFRLYNPTGDLRRWKIVARAKLKGNGGQELSLPPIPLELNVSQSQSGEATVGLNLPFKNVPPGQYRLEIEVTEAETDRRAVVQTDLELLED